VGERYGTWWVISEGLKPGERVAVEGVQKVKEGEKVTPKLVKVKPPAKPETAGGAAPAASTPAPAR
jgi:hypothetical protein